MNNVTYSAMKKLIQLLIFSVLLMFVYSFNSTKNEFKNKHKTVFVHSDTAEFLFLARTAMPTGGSIRQLTGDYDIKVSKGSIVSYLPYFGRVYNSTGQTDGGIKFTSSKFEFKSTIGKKGNKEIIIKIKDVQDIQQLIFNISTSGQASLQVTSANRQPITFYGEVKPIE